MPFSMPRRRIYRRPLATEDSDPEIQESQDSQAASFLRSEADLSIFECQTHETCDDENDVDDDNHDNTGFAATFAADELSWESVLIPIMVMIIRRNVREWLRVWGQGNLVRSRHWRADVNTVIEPITLPGCNLNNAFKTKLKTLFLTELEKVQTPKTKILYVAFAAKIPSFAEFEAQNRDLVVSALEGHLFLQVNGGQVYVTQLRKHCSQGVTAWNPVFEGLHNDPIYKSCLRGEDNDMVLIDVFGSLKSNNEQRKKVTTEITIL